MVKANSRGGEWEQRWSLQNVGGYWLFYVCVFFWGGGSGGVSRASASGVRERAMCYYCKH